MTELIVALLTLWAIWAGMHALLFALSAALVRRDAIEFNGFRVRVPERLLHQLTEAELCALIMHEHGHRAHRHVWKNLARACCFAPVSVKERARQELEADAYVTDQAALASALLKISAHPFDHARALAARVRHGAQEARDPTPGMGEQATQKG